MDEETVGHEATAREETHAEPTPPSGQAGPSIPGRYVSLDQYKEIRTCFQEILKEELEHSVSNFINEAVQNEHQSMMREIRELRKFTTFEVNSLKNDFESVVDNKCAEIAT